MTSSQSEPIRATVAAVGGFILGVLAVAVESVPIAALVVADDSCAKALVANVGLPLALVGALLALGAGYLGIVGHRSPHSVVVFALFAVAVAGAVTVLVLAVGNPSTSTLSACFT